MAASIPASPSPLSPVIPNAPVVVEWDDAVSRPRIPHYLAGPDPAAVQLNLLFNEEENTVSLKIRVRLYLEQAPGVERKEYVYICFNADNVHWLLRCPTRPLPRDMATAAGVRGPTSFFRIVLHNPIAVLAPMDAPVPLRSTRSSSLLDAVEELSRQTVLGIHVSQSIISDANVLRGICEAFTNGSIIQYTRHDSTGDFYQGRGAAVVQHFAGSARPTGRGEDAGPTTEEDNEVHGQEVGAGPPSYPEAQEQTMPPPPPPLLEEPKKRQRSPEDSASLPKRRQLSCEGSNTIHQVFENIGAKLLAQQEAQMTRFMSWQQAQMAKLVEQQQAVFSSMDRTVQGMESRIMERVEEHLRIESDAIDAHRDRGKEELMCELKSQCIDELKDILEDGLVSIVLLR